MPKAARPILALLAIPVLSFAVPTGDKLPDPVKDALESIRRKDVERHELFLTSSECAGRDTPSAGLLKAAEYLIEQYKSFGVAGAGADGGFLHEFEIPALVYSEGDYVAVLKGADESSLRTFKPGVDFVPIRGCPSGEVEGSLVFAGYGLKDDKEKYDDFRGVNVKDRIVLVLSHEPRQDRDGPAFDGKEFTEGARIEAKARAAAELGARAVLVVSNPMHHQDLSVLKAEMPRFFGGGGPRRTPDGKEAKGIPLVHVSGELADALVSMDKLKEWQQKIDKNLRGAPQDFPQVQVRLKVSIEQKPYKVHNVVAQIPGKDPKLQNEWVILGAHYDHVGMDSFGRIFHGADDNASGTACLLEIAQALSSKDVELRRSVLLIHFAGEEKGLLGARAFTKNPLFPLESAVAMLNMDMVGRGRPHDIDAVGMQYSNDLEALVKKAVSQTRTQMRVGSNGMQYFLRSDQLPFWQAGIPVLFFMEPEEHPDYHKVTDTPDKVDMDKIERLARVVTGLTVLLSEQDGRPTAKTGKDGEESKN